MLKIMRLLENICIIQMLIQSHIRVCV